MENISDRAAGYHIPGVVVDGQDPFAVYEAAKAAVERARAGEGPTMIECKTYRIEGHFVGDPELYRSKEETMKIFHDTDPLKKFREKIANINSLLEQIAPYEKERVEKVKERITDALEKTLSVDYDKNRLEQELNLLHRKAGCQRRKTTP